MIALGLLLLLSSADPTTDPTTTTTSPTAATQKLAALRLLFEQLDCEKVIAAAPLIEDHRLATLDERLEASFRHAYCLVVLGNISEASQLFAAVVAEKVDANPPFDVEPRVQILIEAARAEEVKRRADAAAQARQAQVDRVVLDVHAPTNLTGGNRAFFYVDVTDPDALVSSLRIEFRKQAAPSDGAATGAARGKEFYALPVVKQTDGRWRGEIPGTYTRSTNGLVLEWFISASDGDGAFLKSVGARDAPRTLEIGPGSALALDLKASERLTHETRLTLAVLGVPFVSAAFAGAAFAASTVISDFPGAGLLNTFVVALLPPAAATFGTWAVASSILDAPDVIVTVLTVGAFGALFTGAAFIDGGINLAVGDAFARPTYLAALSAGVVGVLAGGTVATVLVALDDGTGDDGALE